MSQFRDAYGEFRRLGIEVAGISVDSPYSHRVWAKQIGVDFPLISDFGRVFLRAYGVPERDLHLMPGTASRSAFLVDAAQILRFIWHPPDGRGLPPVDQVLEAARTLSR